jgi:hypothetical protein
MVRKGSAVQVRSGALGIKASRPPILANVAV